MDLSLLFWSLLSVSSALAEVSGARLPGGALKVPVCPEQLRCLVSRVSGC